MGYFPSDCQPTNGLCPVAMEPVWIKGIRERMQAKGFTMKSASLAAGLNETFVRDILERGKIPSIDKFAKLAAVLGATVGELLEEGHAPADGSAAVPIRSQAEILAMLERIEGLKQTDVEIAFAVITNALAVNKAAQAQGDSGDRSERPSRRLVSSPSR